jgi:predicted N-acetyltransferase YhbS
LSGFEIVRYRPDHRRQVAELQTRLWFDDVESNLDYLQWKYHENPHAEEPLAVLAIDGDRVIGMRGLFGALIEFGQPARRTPIYLAGDLAVSEDWENSGVFPALMNAAMDELRRRGHSHLLSFGATDRTMLAQLATGWRATAPLCQLTRPRQDTSLLLRNWLLAKPALRRLARFVPGKRRQGPFVELMRRPRRRAAAPLTWTDTPRFRDMAALVDRLAHDGRIRQVRDEAYLRWRLSNPMHSRYYGYWVEDALEGYVILEARRQQLRQVYLLDAEASRPEILVAILEHFTSRMRGSTITAFSRCLPGRLGDRLAEFGFVKRVPQTALGRALPCIMARHVGDDPGDTVLDGVDLADLAQWDMRRLYNM